MKPIIYRRGATNRRLSKQYTEGTHNCEGARRKNILPATLEVEPLRLPTDVKNPRNYSAANHMPICTRTGSSYYVFAATQSLDSASLLRCRIKRSQKASHNMKKPKKETDEDLDSSTRRFIHGKGAM